MDGDTENPNEDPGIKYQYNPFEKFGHAGSVAFVMSAAGAKAPNRKVLLWDDRLPTKSEGPLHDTMSSDVMGDP